MTGTEGARRPFWKPDNQAIGFPTNDAVKVVRLSGGVPVRLCGSTSGDGLQGTWNRSGVILFSDLEGLHRVRESATEQQ